MMSTLMSRRALAFRMASIPAALCATARAFGASNSAEDSTPANVDGLSHTSDAIHQEIIFNAARRRVFEALTDSVRFDALTRLSDALTLVTAPEAKATSISREVGGPFTLFGGYITGRNLELLKDERLVQAWRTAGWKAGDYSVVKFSLLEYGAATKLIFDHRGFPDGQGAHLADGWHVHYWDPLAKLLSQS